MGMMATIQFYKTKRNQLFATPVKINEEVTVIIPAFNEEVNAVATIYSLLRQTYALKIIFVDDGSTDTTLEKIKEEFLHERRLTIISKRNGGKASALNEGILYADSLMLYA
jgi:glycosyltransferase involved in cell wall biosynthesis